MIQIQLEKRFRSSHLAISESFVTCVFQLKDKTAPHIDIDLLIFFSFSISPRNTTKRNFLKVKNHTDQFLNTHTTFVSSLYTNYYEISYK